MRPASARTILAAARTPAFLVTDLTNIRYLSGISLTSGLLLVTQRRLLLFVDARYRYEAENRCGKGITIRDIGDLPKFAKDLPECGLEADKVTIARNASLKRKFPNTKFVRRIGVIEEFRRRKADDELRLMRRAERMTKELLRRVPSALRVGISEEKLARQLAIWALELGGDGLAFDPIVAFGTHTSSPHHAPTSRSLQKGHIVQIDVGVKYKGYCSDMSRVYFTGVPTAAQKKVYDTLLRAQKAVLQKAKAGVTNHELDKTAREILRREGMEDGFVHALGHGVGLDIHEGITLSQRQKEQKLLSGEVITVEPGVYFPGKFGMRLEDQVFVA